jgi:hypothetical protein
MNERLLTVTLAIALTLAGSAPAAAESYHFRSTTTTTREGEKKPQSGSMSGWVDGGNVKIEFPDDRSDGRVRKGMYLLTTDAGATVFMVDPENKIYYEFDPELMMGVAAGMLQLEVSDASIEKLGEEPGGQLQGHDTTLVKLRTQFAMTMNVLGMERVDRYDSTQEIWTTDAIGGQAWTLWLKMLPSTVENDELVGWAEDTGLAHSFPLRSRAVTKVTDKKGRTSTMTSDMQVVDLRIEAVPAAVFEIPADYTRQEMLPAEWGGESGEGSPANPLKGLFGKKKKDGR